MFVRYLNLFNKHMSGTSYGMMGVILGIMIGNYKRDLQTIVLILSSVYLVERSWWIMRILSRMENDANIRYPYFK